MSLGKILLEILQPSQALFKRRLESLTDDSERMTNCLLKLEFAVTEATRDPSSQAAEFNDDWKRNSG